MKIIARDIPPRAAWALEQAGVHPLLARLYAARGVRAKDELDDGLARLLPPTGLKGINAAARLLADAMAQNKRLCIVADYDCDAKALVLGHGVGQQALQPGVLVLECLQPFRLGHVHAAVLGSPLVEGGVAEAPFAA